MKRTMSATPEHDPRLIDLDDGAKRLLMSRRTLERKIAKGVIPVARHGGRGGKLRTFLWVSDLDLYWKRLRVKNFNRKSNKR